MSATPGSDVVDDGARAELIARAAALIDRLAAGDRDDVARDALMVAIARWQAERVGPFRRLLTARGLDLATIASVDDGPAIPTDVFRFTRVAAHPAEADVRVFRTSGTTQVDRGVHALRDLALYDRAARAAARHALFPDLDRIRLIILAPDEGQAPDSSLSYMLSRFVEWFGAPGTCHVWRDGTLDHDALARALDDAAGNGTPIALLGTSFALLHADEALGARRWALPAASRIMQTGGFKGRTREVEPGAMRALLSSRYDIPDRMIVAEYGMTELSSQLYETTLRDAFAGGSARPRHLWIPGWVRATPVDPESLRPVPDGEVGILRLDDCANLDTAVFVQTSDLARRLDDGIELIGRAPGATPRGCSLAVDAILGSLR